PSPILNLPDELTYDIFLTCHRDNPRNFPAVASAVCSHWRNIALSIPALWSTIHFDKSLQNGQDMKRFKKQVKRAQTAPLDIFISGAAVPDPVTDSISKVCQVIIPSITTWRSLVIGRDVKKGALQSLLDRLKNTSAPTLENLAIQPVPESFQWDIEPSAEWKLEVFRNDMPRLQSLQLSRCRFDWNLDVFHGIMDLEIHDHRFSRMGPNEVIKVAQNIIVRSPQLSRLVLTDSWRHTLPLRAVRSPPPRLQETFCSLSSGYLN
ncbi:hypothetical protein FRC01_010132, partial [Tulasnella sp. 417]